MHKSLIKFAAISASLMGLTASAQMPQFIARRDIQLSGSIIAQGGDLVNVSGVNADKVTLVLSDGEDADVSRSVLADINEAIPVLTSLLQKTPKDIRLHTARANVHALRKEFPQAIEFATRAIELSDSKDALLYVNRGMFYSSTGQHTKAAADFVKATHINASLYSAYTNLAAAHIARQEYQKAIDICTSVIKVDRDNPAHYVQRGVANRYLKEWDAAVADFTTALKLKPNDLAALGSRGFVNYLKGDHAAAATDFDAIIQLTPDDAMAYNNRGYNLFLSGDSKAALADYDKALEINPNYAAAWQNKAWLLATSPDGDLRNGEAAIAAAKKAADQRQQIIAADIKALAAGYAETGDFANAIKYQGSVIELVDEQDKDAERKILEIYSQRKPYRMTSNSAE